jgi:hypothetical protein
MWVHDPFWGIDTIRDAVKRGGSGPTWLMVLAGLVLIAVGVIQAPVLIVLGALLVVIGGWPIVRRLRAGRDTARLEAHARREDAILLLAGEMPAMSATRVAEARAQLAVLVAADASAAEFAREEGLRRAAHDPGAADSWFDVANEILAATKTPAATPYP